MRSIFILLLLCSVLLPVSMHAQTWSKKTYNVPGFRALRADFTGDGFPDLLVFDDNNTISVLPNAGNGTFDTTRIHTLNLPVVDAVTLDFNRDGNTDIAGCTNDGTTTTFIIWQGNGDGSLSPLQTIPMVCSWVATADFNHDGNPDVAVGINASTTGGDNQVIVFLGDGHGGFAGQVVNDNVNFISSEGNPCSLDGRAVAADFTGDKVADLFITADCPDDVVSFGAIIVGKGDGTGHFTFHKDLEDQFDAGMNLRLVDANQQGRTDVYATAEGSGPHGSGWSDLVLFLSHGDGTFETRNVITENMGGGSGSIVRATAFADFDGDGIKDGIGMIDNFDDSGTETMTMQFFKGRSDGTYTLIQTSPLASQVFDMLWGDFNKDSRPDLALVRPNTTDVWLNTTASASTCNAAVGLRTINACTTAEPNGVLHFLSSPLDNFQINAIQIYVDSVLKFETSDDLLDNTLQLTSGQHHITFKAWDDLGSFSASTTMTVAASCTNSTNRTVKICSPVNGSTSTSSVHVVASAATNLKFSSTQIYLDGALKFNSGLKNIDTTITGVGKGTHHITVKGWDSSGAFSSATTVTVQ
jgi:hypothetical protein